MTEAAPQFVPSLDGTAQGVTAIHLDPEPKRLFVASERDGLFVYDLEKRESESISTGAYGIRGMAPAPWGMFLLAWSDKKIVWQWSMVEPGRLDQLESPFVINSAVSLEDSRIAASSFETPNLVILAHGRSPLFRKLHSAPITCVRFQRQSPLITSSLDGTLGVWDPRGFSVAAQLKGHTDAVWGCELFENSRIVSFSADRTLRSWSWSSGKWGPLAVMRGHQDEISAIALGPASVVSASWDGTLKVWDVNSGAERLSIPVGRGRITHVATAPGRIAAASEDRTITLWDTAGNPAGVFPGVSAFTSLGMSGETLFAGDAAGNFWVFDTGPVHEKLRLPARVAALALKENMDLAGEVARAVDYSGPQFVNVNPVEVESALESSDLTRILNEHAVTLLFACNNLHDIRYLPLLEQLLRRAVHRNRLIVTFEDPARWLWSGSALTRHNVFDWPEGSDLRQFAQTLRRAVWNMSDEKGPMPDDTASQA